jgi:hypothetical protein
MVHQDPEMDAIVSVDINMSVILDACHNLLVADQQLEVCQFPIYRSKNTLRVIRAKQMVLSRRCVFCC